MPQFYIDLIHALSHDFLSTLVDYNRIPDAIGAILLVSILGLLTGPLAGSANPFYWMVLDGLFGGLGDKLDRRHRAQGTLVIRGLLITILILVISLFIARGPHLLDRYIALPYRPDVLLLALCLTAGTVWRTLARLYIALEKQQVGKGAYYTLSHSARVNLSNVDDFGITRSALNYAARSFDKAMIAPVFWYLVAGLPALFVYSGIAALNWRFGKHGFTKGFGFIPLTLEKFLGFIPAFFSGLFLTLATIFTPHTKIHKAFASWFVWKGRSPYNQGGTALTVMAWALNLSLGGPEQDSSGSAMQSEWVGPTGASAKVSHKNLRQGIYMHGIAHLLLIASLLATYVWAKGGLPDLLALWPF